MNTMWKLFEISVLTAARQSTFLQKESSARSSGNHLRGALAQLQSVKGRVRKGALYCRIRNRPGKSGRL